MSFKFDASGLLSGLAEYEMKTRAALGLYTDTSSKKMEAYAKENRLWTDRTSDARNTLEGTWKWIGDKTRIKLSHGVDYGIYLEFCNEKRYAIIQPTIDIMSPEIIRGLDKLLK